MSCQFKDILGKPGEGPHSIRLGGFAVVDSVLTILLAWYVSKWVDKPFPLVLLVVFIIGEILHWVFCVDTAFIKLIGLQKA
jgi:accessory gene regulator protein AgrB